MKLSKENYLEHLNDIAEKIKDFTQKIKEGKYSYFQELSLKLRILYCDKSGTKALIKTIEQVYKLNISVIVAYSIEERVKKGSLPESLLNGLIFEQLNSVAHWFEFGDELIPVMDAITKKDEILIENKLYSYEEIFEAVADKMGGAHVDSSIPDEMLIPHSENLQIGGLSVAHRAIFDTAIASVKLIELINEFIKTGKETDFLKKAN